MIIKGLFELVYILLGVAFFAIDLPDLDQRVVEVIDELVYSMLDLLGFLSLVVDINMLKTLLPVVLIIANFEKVWSMIMFVLRKIPFLGIK